MQKDVSKDDDAVDYRGIPGWGKVDALARVLLRLTGLCMSSSEAEHIIQLYNQLDEFDRRQVTFIPRPQRPPRGRFARYEQHHSGQVTVDNMKRFLYTPYSGKFSRMWDFEVLFAFGLARWLCLIQICGIDRGH